MNEKTKYITKRWSDKREESWSFLTFINELIRDCHFFLSLVLDDHKARDESHFLLLRAHKRERRQVKCNDERDVRRWNYSVLLHCRRNHRQFFFRSTGPNVSTNGNERLNSDLIILALTRPTDRTSDDLDIIFSKLKDVKALEKFHPLLVQQLCYYSYFESLEKGVTRKQNERWLQRTFSSASLSNGRSRCQLVRYSQWNCRRLCSVGEWQSECLWFFSLPSSFSLI